jgi:hypothetical protein
MAKAVQLTQSMRAAVAPVVFTQHQGASRSINQPRRRLPIAPELKLGSHSDQFGQGFGAHLPHHVPTLHFHRDFAGPELIRYLFIEHA